MSVCKAIYKYRAILRPVLTFCSIQQFTKIWCCCCCLHVSLCLRYSQCGRLSGHQAPVMSLALHKDSGHTMVISGSKDHYIKVRHILILLFEFLWKCFQLFLVSSIDFDCSDCCEGSSLYCLSRCIAMLFIFLLRVCPSQSHFLISFFEKKKWPIGERIPDNIECFLPLVLDH